MSFTIQTIREALSRHEPKLATPEPGNTAAAVALVLAGREHELSMAFIRRAEHPLDPWSGHMALPGGRWDPTDPHPRAAAERETLEEVGISLADAHLLGRLDDLEGRHAGRRLPLVISAYVYHADHHGPLVPNEEVESAFWVPLERLFDPRHHVEYPTPWAGYPGILIGEPERHVVWGLTYRFLEIFLARLGRPLPDRWIEVPQSLLEEEE